MGFEHEFADYCEAPSQALREASRRIMTDYVDRIIRNEANHIRSVAGNWLDTSVPRPRPGP